MTQLYELVGSPAASPVDLATMKACMKVTTATDDTFIQILIDAATEYGEKYTSRSFRAINYKLSIDTFDARICLRRSPVASITSIQHLVDDVLTTVPSATYYLKKGVQWSEVLLNDGQAWPTDTDPREQAIEIVFATIAYTPCANAIINGIKRYVTYAYMNRGDCEGEDDVSIGKQSGADTIFNQFRISRV